MRKATQKYRCSTGGRALTEDWSRPAPAGGRGSTLTAALSNSKEAVHGIPALFLYTTKREPPKAVSRQDFSEKEIRRYFEVSSNKTSESTTVSQAPSNTSQRQPLPRGAREKGRPGHKAKALLPSPPYPLPQAAGQGQEEKKR